MDMFYGSTISILYVIVQLLNADGYILQTKSLLTTICLFDSRNTVCNNDMVFILYLVNNKKSFITNPQIECCIILLRNN